MGVDLGDDGYAIYRVNAVVTGGTPVDPQRLAAAQQQIAQVQSQSEVEAYVEALRARSKVKPYGSLEQRQRAGERPVRLRRCSRVVARLQPASQQHATAKAPRNRGAFCISRHFSFDKLHSTTERSSNDPGAGQRLAITGTN